MATYLVNESGVELLEAAQTPAGVLSQAEPALLSRKLWEDNRVVMVSDGVLEALPGGRQGAGTQRVPGGHERKGSPGSGREDPGLCHVFSPENRDDMTVLTAGIWQVLSRF